MYEDGYNEKYDKFVKDGWFNKKELMTVKGNADHES